jgi:hypothetical protein
MGKRDEEGVRGERGSCEAADGVGYDPERG